VHQLTEAWRYELKFGGFGAAATTPIIIDGVVYLGDLLTNVHAIDLETGRRLWMAEVDDAIYGPGGVAVDGGKVFSSKGGNAIAAYDASSGEELWSTDLVQDKGAIEIQPTVVDGLVLAATSALARPGSRGTLFALNQETGDIVWSFDTIVSEDLWGHPDVNSGGGAWFTPAVDTGAGISYWGTSNPYPYPGAPGFPNASSRPGDNRWTNSLLALDIESGELLWGHQIVPHDLFDRDAAITAVVELAGGDKVIVNTGKHGRVVGFAPNGTPLWDTRVGMHQNDDVESFEGPLEVLPGIIGGVVTPISFADGVIYVAVVNAPTPYSDSETANNPNNVKLAQFPSQLVALDAETGKTIWDVELPGDCFGATTVVNDLVFTSVLAGHILAFDRATGEKVWSYKAPGGINGWPAFVDDTMVIPVGFGNPPVLLSLSLEGD
jgi:outer membrane protein assembly factor BamB